MDKKKNASDVIALIIKISIIGMILFLINQYVFGIMFINNNNMFPRISEGDLVFYYRLSSTYYPGDVVIAEVDGNQVVARVIGQEGDTIDFSQDGKVIVNDMPLTPSTFYEAYANKEVPIQYPVLVESEKYFLLSDYCSENDSDSRSFGAVNKNQIKGKTITVLRRRCF